jgi:hypothetical protein
MGGRGLKISKKIQAKEIEKLLDDSKSKFRILNFYGFEVLKTKALKDYRKTHSNMVRLFISEDMEEMEWMCEIEEAGKKFTCNRRGLYKQL